MTRASLVFVLMSGCGDSARGPADPAPTIAPIAIAPVNARGAEPVPRVVPTVTHVPGQLPPNKAVPHPPPPMAPAPLGDEPPPMPTQPPNPTAL